MVTFILQQIYLEEPVNSSNHRNNMRETVGPLLVKKKKIIIYITFDMLQNLQMSIDGRKMHILTT